MIKCDDILTVDEVSGIQTEADKWRAAINKEFKTLVEMGTWEDVAHVPKDINIVGSRFTLKRKRNSRGEITSCKARLVAQGVRQAQGIDYHETFAPTSSLENMRILLTIGLTHNMIIHQMDVDSAFLHAKINKNVYMCLPRHCGPQSGKVVKLCKSLYGLKQARCEWFLTLADSLVKLGYFEVGRNTCIFRRETTICTDIIMAYVDDLLIMTKKELMKYFKMKDLGEVHELLGIKIERQGNKETP